MRFIVPINAASEVDALVRAGAHELYCGLADAWWTERYGNHDSISRRQGDANLHARAELQELVGRAQDCNIPVSLALNARYTEPQLDYLEQLCLWFERIGGSGLIVSDTGLLTRLAGKTSLPRTLSILAVAENTGSVRAYGQLGVSRIVLPRFATPELAGTLKAGAPSIEMEVMAFFDKCRWVDGYCRNFHGVGYQDWTERALTPAELEHLPTMHSFCTTFCTHACMKDVHTPNPHPCGACHLPLFEQAGVRFAKLGGRGLPLQDRIRALEFLSAALQAKTDEQRQQRYRETFHRECFCYYDAGIQKRTSIEARLSPVPASNRVFLGSQTSFQQLLDDLDALGQARTSAPAMPITVLMPPLSQEEFEQIPRLFERFKQLLPQGSHLCVNDLGTLIQATGSFAASQNIRVTVGSLLGRIDNFRLLSDIADPANNPTRIVWGADGTPCKLVHKAPPISLQAHWNTPSFLEPSSSKGVAQLTANYPLCYESALPDFGELAKTIG